MSAESPRRWTLYVCTDCGERAHGPGSRCSKDRGRTWTPMVGVEVMPVSEHDTVLENMVPADLHGLLTILDTWYPADVFTGSSEDVGARLVVLAREIAHLREAARALVTEGCREEMGAPSYDKCWKPAEFVLWGKLIPPEGLGPRCYEHAAKHVGHRALAPGENYALMDLRPVRAALEEKP